MLLWKQQRPEQQCVTRVPTAETTEVSERLLPERSNEDLLAELQDLAALQRTSRKWVIGLYVAGLALYSVAMFATLLLLAPSANHSMLGFLIPLLVSVAFLPISAVGALQLGRRFYARANRKFASLLPALAQRGEVRALPTLLSLMDMRVNGVVMWQASRPVLLGALEALLARETVEEFQELSRPQMWDIAMMLYFPDGRLREVAAETMVRCGDNRTLETLKKLQKLCAVGVPLTNSPIVKWNPMIWYMRKAGVPLATMEAKVVIDNAVAGLALQVEEMHRTAQLLRASGRNEVPAGRELMRAAVSPGAPAAPDQLVRANPATCPDTSE